MTTPMTTLEKLDQLEIQAKRADSQLKYATLVPIDLADLIHDAKLAHSLLGKYACKKHSGELLVLKGRTAYCGKCHGDELVALYHYLDEEEQGDE